jgi:hypothetical protein
MASRYRRWHRTLTTRSRGAGLWRGTDRTRWTAVSLLPLVLLVLLVLAADAAHAAIEQRDDPGQGAGDGVSPSCAYRVCERRRVHGWFLPAALGCNAVVAGVAIPLRDHDHGTMLSRCGDRLFAAQDDISSLPVHDALLAIRFGVRR